MNATKKVLVIDDDPVVGKSIDRVLSPKGYAVISAANGEEALDRLAREDYDMVYTDIKMPGLSGLEVARRIKASRPWLPVVVVTGYGTEANEAEAKELGVAGFMHKPLSPDLIEGIANEVTRRALPQPAVAAAAAPAPKGALHFARNVGLFIVAPFIALVYVVLGPFIGLGMLAYFAIKRLVNPEKVNG